MSRRAQTAFIMMTFLSGQQVAAHDVSSHLSSSVDANSDSFDVQMGAAMERMDRDMAISSTGNPDRDFAAMMIPHHQGAVDMARLELQFGKDPALRRLAEAIIVEQLQEIEVMRRRLATLPHAPRESDGLTDEGKDHQ
jgi:uncharacterized protein (DUF305 family)